MSQHPNYYAMLVHRRASPEDTLSAIESEELDLHLTICPRCAYELAEQFRPHEPAAARAVLNALEERLSADLVAPYLHELAVAIRNGASLDGFQRTLWHYLLRDAEAMGDYFLVEAMVCLRDQRLNADWLKSERRTRQDGTTHSRALTPGVRALDLLPAMAEGRAQTAFSPHPASLHSSYRA